ncbi:hypothetical protein BsWGS_24758 [Bradybaena similaris]
MKIIQDFLLKRRWIILTFSFALVTLATSAYLIYREIYRPKTSILSKYGYLFRHEIDLEILNRRIQKQRRLPVTETGRPSTDTCNLSCSKKGSGQQGQNQGNANVTTTDNYRQSNDSNVNKTEYVVNYIEPMAAPLTGGPHYSYHGCCQSYQEYRSPASMSNTLGTQVRIVQFRTKQQWFLVDTCKKVPNCNRHCECAQQLVTAVALVVDLMPMKTVFDEKADHDYIEKHARIELVEYPGWCKCFNV